jgi:hypothetical protein
MMKRLLIEDVTEQEDDTFIDIYMRKYHIKTRYNETVSLVIYEDQKK